MIYFCPKCDNKKLIYYPENMISLGHYICENKSCPIEIVIYPQINEYWMYLDKIDNSNKIEGLSIKDCVKKYKLRAFI